MNSLEFRTQVMSSLREFEKWAWKDSRENPADYESMTFDDWFAMFNTYLGDNR